MPQEWAQGPCQCTNDAGLCFYTWCCPCLAFKEIAENIDDNNGLVYCLATFPCGCGCCVLTVLGDNVAKKRGIESGIVTSCCKTVFDVCFCYSCTVMHESRLHKQEKAKTGGVQAEEMERK